MQSIYAEALQRYRATLRATHPIILALFDEGGGTLILYPAGAEPVTAPARLGLPAGQVDRAQCHGLVPAHRPLSARARPAAWRGPLAAYRDLIAAALPGLGELELADADRDAMAAILAHNLAFLDTALAAGELRYAALERFARGQTPLIERAIAVAAQGPGPPLDRRPRRLAPRAGAGLGPRLRRHQHALHDPHPQHAVRAPGAGDGRGRDRRAAVPVRDAGLHDRARRHAGDADPGRGRPGAGPGVLRRLLPHGRRAGRRGGRGRDPRRGDSRRAGSRSCRAWPHSTPTPGRGPRASGVQQAGQRSAADLASPIPSPPPSITRAVRPPRQSGSSAARSPGRCRP